MATSSKTVELKLKVTPEKSALVVSAMAKLEEQVKRTQKTLVMQNQSADDLTKKLTAAGSAMRNLGSAATSAGSTMRGAFSQVGRAFDGINAKIDGFKAKFLNLRTLLVGSAIGGAVLGIGGKILSEGRSNFANGARLRRRFGADADRIGDLGSEISKRTGIDDGAISAGLGQIFDATDDVRAGQMFRGKRLTGTSAKAIRDQTMGTGRRLFERLLKLHPDKDPEELGTLLAEAGASSAGFVRLGTSLGLRRSVVKQVMEATQKGQLNRIDPEAAKRLGIKAGDKGTGSGLEMLFEKTGETEKAATEATKTFDFQLRAVSTTINGALGNIGLSVFEKLNKEIGKGGDLAGKLQAYLASPAGKEMIDKTASVMAKLVDATVKLVSKLPAIIDFFEKHKTSIMLLGGAYLGIRGYGAAKGLFGGGGGAPGGGGGGLGAPAGAVPVYVVGGSMGGPGMPGGIPGGAGGKPGLGGLIKNNLGALVMAGAGGYALGTVLDEQFGLSNELAGVRGDGYHDVEDSQAIRRQRAMDQYRGLQKAVASGRMSSGMAADALERSVGRIGVDSTFGQYLTSALATGSAASADPTAGDIAKQKSAQVNFEIGNIVLQGAGMTPEALVDALMPKLRDRMVKQVQLATAGGAAPGGAR